MKPGSKSKPPADTTWQESQLPGERSGEGMADLFKLMERDLRRKAGLPPKEKRDKKP